MYGVLYPPNPNLTVTNYMYFQNINQADFRKLYISVNLLPELISKGFNFTKKNLYTPT